MSTLTLSVGDAGIELGHQYWKLLCLEHCINPDLSFTPTKEIDAPPVSFFRETIQQTYRPRSILIDIDPRTSSKVLKSDWKDLHDISPTPKDPPSRENWPEIHFNFGRKPIPQLANSIRRQVENCPSLDSFHMIHSLSKCSSSAMASGLLIYLKDEFPKAKFQSFITAPEMGESPTHPYNFILTTPIIGEFSSLICILPSQDIFHRKNAIRSFYLSTLTASARYQSVPHYYSILNCMSSKSSFDKYIVSSMLELPPPNVPLRLDKKIVQQDNCFVFRCNFMKVDTKEWFLQYPIGYSKALQPLRYCIQFSKKPVVNIVSNMLSLHFKLKKTAAFQTFYKVPQIQHQFIQGEKYLKLLVGHYSASDVSDAETIQVDSLNEISNQTSQTSLLDSEITSMNS